MRGKLKDSEHAAAGKDVGLLLRFLRARDFDVEKSHLMLVEALEYLNEHKPHEITAEELGDEIKTGPPAVVHPFIFAL